MVILFNRCLQFYKQVFFHLLVSVILKLEDVEMQYLLHFGFFLHVNCTVGVNIQVIYRFAIFRGDAEL